MECPICTNGIDLEDISSFAKLTKKGITSIVNAGKIRNHALREMHVGDLVHLECRKKFTNINNLDNVQKHKPSSSSSDITPKKKLRQSTGNFDYETQCLFCTKEITDWEIKTKKVCNVGLANFKKSISV